VDSALIFMAHSGALRCPPLSAIIRPWLPIVAIYMQTPANANHLRGKDCQMILLMLAIRQESCFLSESANAILSKKIVLSIGFRVQLNELVSAPLSSLTL